MSLILIAIQFLWDHADVVFAAVFPLFVASLVASAIASWRPEDWL